MRKWEAGQSNIHNVNHFCSAPEQLLDHILAVCVECVQCGVPSLRPLRCLHELVSTRTIAVNTHHVMAIAWLLLKHVLSLPTVSILLTSQ